MQLQMYAALNTYLSLNRCIWLQTNTQTLAQKQRFYVSAIKINLIYLWIFFYLLVIIVCNLNSIFFVYICLLHNRLHNFFSLWKFSYHMLFVCAFECNCMIRNILHRTITLLSTFEAQLFERFSCLKNNSLCTMQFFCCQHELAIHRHWPMDFSIIVFRLFHIFSGMIHLNRLYNQSIFFFEQMVSKINV